MVNRIEAKLFHMVTDGGLLLPISTEFYDRVKAERVLNANREVA